MLLKVQFSVELRNMWNRVSHNTRQRNNKYKEMIFSKISLLG
jgi:hypothetical protein